MMLASQQTQEMELATQRWNARLNLVFQEHRVHRDMAFAAFVRQLRLVTFNI